MCVVSDAYCIGKGGGEGLVYVVDAGVRFGEVGLEDEEVV